MLIENEFTVSAPVDFLWGSLLNVERIAPCMPGAELTEVVDDKNYNAYAEKACDYYAENAPDFFDSLWDSKQQCMAEILTLP